MERLDEGFNRLLGPGRFLWESTIPAGHGIGAAHAVAFEHVLNLSI